MKVEVVDVAAQICSESYPMTNFAGFFFGGGGFIFFFLFKKKRPFGSLLTDWGRAMVQVGFTLML